MGEVQVVVDRVEVGHHQDTRLHGRHTHADHRRFMAELVAELVAEEELVRRLQFVHYNIA